MTLPEQYEYVTTNLKCDLNWMFHSLWPKQCLTVDVLDITEGIILLWTVLSWLHNCITGVKHKTITKNTTYFISGSQTKVQSHQLRLWYTVGKSGPCRDDGPALLSPAPPQHPRQLSQHRDIRGDTGKLTQQFLTCHQSNSRSYVIYFNIRAFCCHSF